MQILLIDDDSVSNFINKEVLHYYNESLFVQDFTNAIDGLEYLKNSEISSFLIFLDIRIPIISGWDFLDELKKLNLKHKMEVNILSSSITESDKVKAFSYSIVNNYFEKPLTTKDLDKCL